MAAAALLASQGRAADRADSLLPADNPMGDITDVYAWVSGANLELVMDVSPQDDGTHSFDPSILYVFHLTSRPSPPFRSDSLLHGTETRVICRFASNTSVQCWVASQDGSTTKDYVAGDPSNPAGVTSILGKVKVFAGRRSDPSSFNVSGFDTAIANLTDMLNNPTGSADSAGCPTWIDGAHALSVRNQLGSGSDSFATSHVMAIVVQLDQALVNTDKNTLVSVWGSTHAAP